MSTESVQSPARENLATQLPLATRMGAEAGYDIDELQAPVRFSGFVCILFGLLSVFCLLGRPLLLLPLAAILFGAIALRRSDFGVPVGTMAAKIGLLLAVGFGACGFFLPWSKVQTLGGQAEFFVKQFLELTGKGEWELVAELQKPYKDRFLPTMPLKEFYVVNTTAAENLVQMRENGVLEELHKQSEFTDWQLSQTPRVFTRWGRQMVDTLWVDKSGTNNQTLQVELEYIVDKQTDIGHWHVTLCQYHRERLVAESIL